MRYTLTIVIGYRESAPPLALRRYVECFWRWAADEAPTTKRVLPDGCLDLVYARAPAAKSSLFWVGAMLTADIVPIAPHTFCFGARFRPGAAVAFLRMPASELTGFDVAASDISPDTRELRERLDSHDDRDAIERIIASWLIDRMSGVYDVDGAMMRWAMRIHAAPQEALEASGALSERQHRRRFTAAVGIGPKRFSRIARVQWLLRRAGAANASWAELASAAGFHDQAHLIREFSALTGTTPAAYFTAK